MALLYMRKPFFLGNFWYYYLAKCIGWVNSVMGNNAEMMNKEISSLKVW